VSFLGPDLEPLQDDLVALGKRHIRYGVKAEYLPGLYHCVCYFMEELLGDKFTPVQRSSWQVVFDFMVTEMIKGLEG
jgi:hemoglobin-like flavoprotein